MLYLQIGIILIIVGFVHTIFHFGVKIWTACEPIQTKITKTFIGICVLLTVFVGTFEILTQFNKKSHYDNTQSIR